MESALVIALLVVIALLAVGLYAFVTGRVVSTNGLRKTFEDDDKDD